MRRPGGDISGDFDAGKGITLTKNGRFRAFRQFRRRNVMLELADLAATISGARMELAGIKFPVHPHSLRHAKGYQLTSKGYDTRAIQAYMGHKNIQHTVLDTKLDPRRFKGFGRD